MTDTTHSITSNMCCPFRLGGEDDEDGGSPGTQPSTIPSRSEAYEQFKKSRGKELNKVFLKNKGKDLSFVACPQC